MSLIGFVGGKYSLSIQQVFVSMGLSYVNSRS